MGVGEGEVEGRGDKLLYKEDRWELLPGFSFHGLEMYYFRDGDFFSL